MGRFEIVVGRGGVDGPKDEESDEEIYRADGDGDLLVGEASS